MTETTKTPQQLRDEKLAAELRANLRRRKQAARKQSAPSKVSSATEKTKPRLD